MVITRRSYLKPVLDQPTAVYLLVCFNARLRSLLRHFILFTEPLAFLKSAPIILRGYLGHRVDIDCSTNHEGATVSLLRKSHPLAAFTKRELEANKLSKKGQVFTLQNLDLRDAGIYACEASNQESRVIRWPPGTGYLILIRGKPICQLLCIRLG